MNNRNYLALSNLLGSMWSNPFHRHLGPTITSPISTKEALTYKSRSNKTKTKNPPNQYLRERGKKIQEETSR